jgi:hypothetical protein
MWLQSSSSPQREKGSLCRMSYNKKTLILGGILVRHPSLKWVTAAPCERCEYMDLGEKPPEAYRLHETPTSSSQAWERLISLVKLSYPTVSARQNDQQNWRSQPSPSRDALTDSPWWRGHKSNWIGVKKLHSGHTPTTKVHVAKLSGPALFFWKNRLEPNLVQIYIFFIKKDIVVHYAS